MVDRPGHRNGPSASTTGRRSVVRRARASVNARAVTRVRHVEPTPPAGSGSAFGQPPERCTLARDAAMDAALSETRRTVDAHLEGLRARRRLSQPLDQLVHPVLGQLRQEGEGQMPTFRRRPGQLRMRLPHRSHSRLQRAAHQRRHLDGTNARTGPPSASAIVPDMGSTARQVAPLDVDAVRTVQVGTVLWAVALVVTLVPAGPAVRRRARVVDLDVRRGRRARTWTARDNSASTPHRLPPVRRRSAVRPRRRHSTTGCSSRAASSKRRYHWPLDQASPRARPSIVAACTSPSSATHQSTSVPPISSWSCSR